jgi:hypothetical protein
MGSSNLAECFEDFVVAFAADAPKETVPRVVITDRREAPHRRPRRLSAGSRRIQVRDTGLRPFRVF